MRTGRGALFTLAVALLGACGRPATGVDAGTGRDGGTDAGRRDAGPPTVDASFDRLEGDVSHPLDDLLRLNDLQAEGTHNSYHLRNGEHVIDDWAYDNAPLGEQLDHEGVRAIELDVHWDPDLQRLRVYHLDIIDPRSTCDRFLDCLVELRRFSDAHPGHHPIFVQIEPKGAAGVTPRALGDELDAEIRAVFGPELLITPDLVRGDVDTLAEGLAAHGWPTLGEVRGRVLFFLDCDRDFCVEYAGDDLEGRVAFVDSEPGDAFAAVRVMNTPGDEVRAAVAAGFLVRTRAVSMPEALEDDAATLQAELDLALSSGAHIISTDVPIPRDDVPIHVEIPDGTPSRCYPITAPAECTSLAIEDPSRIVPP
jgi:hypothetical protein